MTNQTLPPNQASLEISLLSLVNRALILPSSAIVEVVSLAMPQVVAKMPRWFLGYLPWRGLKIPFISFEAVCETSFKIHAESNIVILKTITASLNQKFFAMLIQNTPVKFTIHSNTLEDVVGDLAPYEIANVRLNNILAKIPNSSALEHLMIEQGVLN